MPNKETKKEIENTLKYHFNEYPKEDIIECLLERIPEAEQMEIYKELTE